MMSLTPQSIFGFNLINPGFLPFLALASIPILIYLFNRQRYRRIEWAAMEFLLRAMRKNRRRLQLENWLLLLVRTLIVLIFIFGMLRPNFEDDFVSDLVANRKAEIYIVDRSYSMGLKEAGRSLLFQAIDRIKRQMEKSLNKGDVYGVFLAGGFPEPLFNDPQPVTETRPTLGLDSIDLIYEPFDVAATLEQVANWIASSKGKVGTLPWEVHLYTDLQRRDWVTPDDGVETGIREALAKLEELKVRIILHPFGPPRPRNASVTQLESQSSLVSVDMRTQFNAMVENRSNDVLAGLEAEFWVDGSIQGSRTLQLEPGQSKQVSFPYVFRDQGPARVEVWLKSDDLEEDNRRFLVVEALEALEVVIADGGRAAIPVRVALREGLAVRGDRLTPYNVETVPAENLLRTDLSDVKVLILVDVPSFSQAESAQIEEFLRAGGGVLAFLGPRVDPNSYNQQAFRSGEGWFPYALGRSIVDKTRELYFGIRIGEGDHPAVELWREDPNSELGLAAVSGYWTPRDTVPEKDVIARLTDFSSTPFIVEGRVGRGRIVTIASDADNLWNNLARLHLQLGLIYDSLPFLIQDGGTRRNLSVGEPLRAIVEDYRSRVFLLRPDGGGGARLNLEPRADSKTFDLFVPGQQEPGHYELKFGERGTESDQYSWWLSVNANPDEGDLKRIRDLELAELYTGIRIGERTSAGSEEVAAGPGGEIWRLLFYAVLALMLAEAILARFFAGRRIRQTAVGVS